MKYLGYEYELAGNGEKAVALYSKARESGRAFDAVILDLTVQGGMGGDEAAKRLLEADSGAKVVISSGYVDDPIIKDYRKYGFADAIIKPYKIEELKKLLDKLCIFNNSDS